MGVTVRTIQLIVLAITLALWVPLGFFFWVPLLTRTIAAFSGMVVFVTMTGGDPKTAGRMVDVAITFYPEGFRKIIEALTQSLGTSSFDSVFESNPLEQLDLPRYWIRFALELVWTAVFWIGIFFSWRFLM